jgi:FAD/FMN-containing dehydrogenase
MDKLRNISSWGNYPKQKDVDLYSLHESYKLPSTIRGNGRSYGDAAIGESVVNTLNQNKIIEIDKATNILTIDSGYLLRDVLNFIIPLGYTIATIPGTQFVTIGGMIAADVHGKNHFTFGSFGNWVEELLIQINENEQLWCSSSKNSELYNATIGGMGLTGIILKAKICLLPIKNYLFDQNITTANSLSDLINLFEQCEDSFQVAWIDLLNAQPKYLLFSGNESDTTKNLTSFKLKAPSLTIPKIPFRVLISWLMKLYNKLYFITNNKNKTVDFNGFFFPLDKFNNWNRLYGSNGMIQYQFILPEENAFEGFQEIIEFIKKSNHSPFLSVLKKYKDNTSPGLLSFPIKGYSLALDFPLKEGLIEFLNELDETVIQYNGRIYLAKDACLQAKNIEKMYPNLPVFKSLISKYNYSSNLATRLKIK